MNDTLYYIEKSKANATGCSPSCSCRSLSAIKKVTLLPPKIQVLKTKKKKINTHGLKLPI